MGLQNQKIEFIYWFAYYNLDSPSVRYRAKYPLDYFRKYKKVDSYLVVPNYSIKGIFFFLKAYFSALFFRKKNSLIVIQRVQSAFIYAALLKLLIRIRKQNTVYDLDDADYLLVNPKTIYYFAEHCETISAGSKQLATYLKRFNDRIIHTTSPIVDLSLIKKSKSPLFTVGWIGGFGGDHKESLIEFVFPALQQLTFHFKLIILGVVKSEDQEFIEHYFRNNSFIKIEMPLGIEWNNERDIQQKIISFDIGIATLKNTEIQLSKSGIKAKQYMNNGIPVLSTNLPENNTVVVEGFNGYFCSGANDYAERITEFYNMSDTEYLQFSQNARTSIINFNHDKYFETFEKIKNVQE